MTSIYPYSNSSKDQCGRAGYEHGFTLIEIAIVLVIVGLLLGGLLMPLATQVEGQRRTETEKTLREINEAIIGFALVNGRLPCPANPALATGVVGAGLERAPAPITTVCTGGIVGVVPWATLGVSELDAWGRRFTYRVTDWYSDQILPTNTVAAPPPPPPACVTNPTNASFALCSDGDMLINNGPSLGNVTVAQTIPAVIVSHGKNGRGAYLPTGLQMTCPVVPIPPPVIPPPDEVANAMCPGKTATLFISHSPTSSTAPGGEFDDIVTWVVPATLKGRMVAAGRLP